VNHFGRMVITMWVVFLAGALLALAACGIDSAPIADGGALPPCPPDTEALCTRAGVCTIDGMQCQEGSGGGFGHPDARPIDAEPVRPDVGVLPACSTACGSDQQVTPWCIDGSYWWSYCLPSYEMCEDGSATCG